MYIRHARSEIIYKDEEPIQWLGWMYVYDDDNNNVGSFATLELPWRDNERNVSAIPPSPDNTKVYDIELLQESPSFDYPHYWIKDVPNRSGIKIHKGNYYTQIAGCILVGLNHKDINEDGIIDVEDSREALEELISLVGQEARLEITSYY